MLSISNHLRLVDPAVDRLIVRVPVSTRQSPRRQRFDGHQHQHQQQALQSEPPEREPDLSVRQLLHTSPLLVPPTISVIAVGPSDSVRRDETDDDPDVVTVDYGSAALENLRHTATKTKRTPASRQLPTASRSSCDLADLPVVELKPFTSTEWRPSRSYSASASKALRINDGRDSTATRVENDGTSVFRRKFVTVDTSPVRASSLIPSTSPPLNGKVSNHDGQISLGIPNRHAVDSRSRKHPLATPSTTDGDQETASRAGLLPTPGDQQHELSADEATRRPHITGSLSRESTRTNGTSRHDDAKFEHPSILRQPTSDLVAVGNSQRPLPPRTSQRATKQRDGEVDTGATSINNFVEHDRDDPTPSVRKSPASLSTQPSSMETATYNSVNETFERSRTLPLIRARWDHASVRRRPLMKAIGQPKQITARPSPSSLRDPWPFETDRAHNGADRQWRAIATARRPVTIAATGIEIQVLERFRSTLEHLRRTRTTRAVAEGFGRTVPRQCDVVAKPTYGEARLMSAARRNRRPPKRTNWTTVLASRQKTVTCGQVNLFHLPQFFSFDDGENVDDAPPVTASSSTVESEGAAEKELADEKRYPYGQVLPRYSTPVSKCDETAMTTGGTELEKDSGGEVTETSTNASPLRQVSPRVRHVTNQQPSADPLWHTSLNPHSAEITAQLLQSKSSAIDVGLEGEAQRRDDDRVAATLTDSPETFEGVVASKDDAISGLESRRDVTVTVENFKVATESEMDPVIGNDKLSSLPADSDDDVDDRAPSPSTQTTVGLTVFVTETGHSDFGDFGA